MEKIRIVVICGSGVAMAIVAAYKLRVYLEEENLQVQIDGIDVNELPSRINNYDMVVSSVQVTLKTDKPIFSAIPLITGVGEKALVDQIVAKVKEIQAAKHSK